MRVFIDEAPNTVGLTTFSTTVQRSHRPRLAALRPPFVLPFFHAPDRSPLVHHETASGRESRVQVNRCKIAIQTTEPHHLRNRPDGYAITCIVQGWCQQVEGSRTMGGVSFYAIMLS